MNHPRILIIGNGGAAAHAVMAARSCGHTGEIGLVSDTEGPAFNPMLAPYFLAGKIDFERCFPFGMEFFRKFDVTCYFGSPAEELDPVNRKVRLGNRKQLIYDCCLVATGARPVLPPVPGLNDSRHVFMLRTLKDTLRLEKALRHAETVIILGTSFVGLKLAEICLKQNMKVHLVDIAVCVLPQCTTRDCASMIENKLVREGLNLYMGEGLVEVEDRANQVHLNFESELSLSADLCIACTGVRPNLDFLSSSTVEMDQGILIDDTMATTADGLFAAGDVSQGLNLLSGKREIIGLWGNACYQGRTAGYNMAGQKAVYPGAIPHNVARIMDSTFVSLGDVQGEGKHELRFSKQNDADGSLIELVFRDEKLVGANLLNCLEIGGKLKNAIIYELDLIEKLSAFSSYLTKDELDKMFVASAKLF